MGCTIGLVNTYSTLKIVDAAIYSNLTVLASEAKVIAQFSDAESKNITGLQFVPEIGCFDAYISLGSDILNALENLLAKAFIRNLVQLKRSLQTIFFFGQSIP